MRITHSILFNTTLANIQQYNARLLQPTFRTEALILVNFYR